jgi:hypothetical protein
MPGRRPSILAAQRRLGEPFREPQRIGRAYCKPHWPPPIGSAALLMASGAAWNRVLRLNQAVAAVAAPDGNAPHVATIGWPHNLP